MELRDLAERVLFATTLQEKLQSVPVVTDLAPGSPIVVPPGPGRPRELRWKAQQGTAGGFPGLRRLEDERERGRLLHFLANHELLATELMALVLLRFPDAPAAFRRGVYQTLRDEQEHTRLYLRRMEACGVRFGELPVSGYFWRAISVMQDPMDYVAGLNLTFEQANLDFCRHFAAAFHQVGDLETSLVLEGICRDEVGHVASGLKWFRRWKDPGLSDWEAFRRQLKFPMSPQRAKGIVFNVPDREAAGLDPGFIAELRVFAQSRGRTPSIHVFNPLAEEWIAGGSTWHPDRHARLLASDLASLVQYLGRADDVVLVPRRPSIPHLTKVQEAGFPLPEFVETPAWSIVLGQRDPPAASDDLLQELARRKIGRLRPWAWSPEVLELLGPLFPSVTGEQRTLESSYHSGMAGLYSKLTGACLLHRLLGQFPDATWLCREAEIGVVANSVESVLEAVRHFRRTVGHPIVVKQAIGLAGRNAVRLWEPGLLESQLGWIARAVQGGRPVIVEPWLDRQIDFSIQFESGVDGVSLIGYTVLINDRKGQYQANWAAPNRARCIPAPVLAAMPAPPDLPTRLLAVVEATRRLLEEEVGRVGYRGPMGVDAFVYRTPSGVHRIKPIVEINPRYTMGRLTLELMRQAEPGSFGLFRLINRRQAQAMVGSAEDSPFVALARALEERYPARCGSTSRLGEGALCLTDPTQAQVCLALLILGAPASLPGIILE